MTVHPRPVRVSIASSPAEEGADPPDWPNRSVPVLMPEATSETRMLSILASERFVLVKALKKSPPLISSKKFAGKLVSDVQLKNTLPKLVPEDVLSSVMVTTLALPNQVPLKLTTEDVLYEGTVT